MERNKYCFSTSIEKSTLGNILNLITATLNISPSDATFADKLINTLDKYIKEMKSLTEEVMVHTDIHQLEDHGVVYAYEVEVVPEKDKVVVTREDSNKWEAFLQANQQDVRIILIKSDSLPIVEAKLEVYRALRYHLYSKNILLHHVFENYDEIAKLSFHKKLSFLSNEIRGLSNSIPIDNLTKMISDAEEKVFTNRNIRDICHNVIIRDDGKNVGKAKDRPYVCYSMFTVRNLKRYLVEETLKRVGESLGSAICTDILCHIKSKVKSELKRDLIHLKVELTKELFATISLIVFAVFSVFFSPWLGLLVAAVTFFITLVMSVDVNSVGWRNKVANEISEKVRDNKSAILQKVLSDIEALCRKTSRDLKSVAYSLEAHQRTIQLVDQEQSVELWQKRKGMHVEDRTLLQSHPYILKCIAGHNGNGKQVLKVFLRRKSPAKDQKGEGKPLDQSDVSKIKDLFGNLDDYLFETVDIDTKAKEIKKQAQKITLAEKDLPAIGISKGMKIGQIIQTHSDRIHATYSNVIGIGMSKVRCVGDTIVREPCIVLYCLDKSIIPFGEKPLPEQLEGIYCDSREDFVMFGLCPHPCPASNIGCPEPGCSIGIPSKMSTGSVGFLVKQTSLKDKPSSGFLTASHAALKDFEDLYNKGFLSKHNPDFSTFKIFHPFCTEGDDSVEVGSVVESFIGNYIYTTEDFKTSEKKEGLDFALVTTTTRREENRTTVPVFNDDHRIFAGNFKVVKSGKATGLTEGKLMHGFLSIKVDSQFLAPGYLAFSNCYAIQNSDNGPFFTHGDSGSGVFVIDNDTLRPLGIAFAFLNSETAVCRVDKIVQELALEIVGGPENNQLQTVCFENRKSHEANKPECMEYH